jgi:hypothetical protein
VTGNSSTCSLSKMAGSAGSGSVSSQSMFIVWGCVDILYSVIYSSFLPSCVCVYYCRTYDKAVCGGGGGQ